MQQHLGAAIRVECSIDGYLQNEEEQAKVQWYKDKPQVGTPIAGLQRDMAH